jgi:hypothetical protein
MTLRAPAQHRRATSIPECKKVCGTWHLEIGRGYVEFLIIKGRSRSTAHVGTQQYEQLRVQRMPSSGRSAAASQRRAYVDSARPRQSHLLQHAQTLGESPRTRPRAATSTHVLSAVMLSGQPPGTLERRTRQITKVTSGIRASQITRDPKISTETASAGKAPTND